MSWLDGWILRVTSLNTSGIGGGLISWITNWVMSRFTGVFTCRIMRWNGTTTARRVACWSVCAGSESRFKGRSA